MFTLETMRVRKLTFSLATLTALALIFPGRVHADTSPSDPDKAAALTTVREGNRLLTTGNPEAALVKFKEAHRLVGGEKLYYNFGQAYRAMPGHEVEAYQAFQVYLDRAKTALPESLAAARDEQAEVRRMLALITVITTPDGATVTIDDLERGETPITRPLALKPGSHSLRVAKRGHRPLEDVLNLSAGQTLERVLVLTKLEEPVSLPPTTAAVPTIPPPIPMPPSVVTQSGLTTPLAALDQDAGGRPIYRRWWFWTAVGAAIVTGVVIAATQAGGTRTEFTCPRGQTCSWL